MPYVVEFLVQHVDVDVKMHNFAISDTDIGTDSVESCAVLLLDFLLNDNSCTYLYHYSYLSFNEYDLMTIPRKILYILSFNSSSFVCFRN
jgi:hypothetical protein